MVYRYFQLPYPWNRMFQDSVDRYEDMLPMHHKDKDHFLGLLLQPYHQLKIGIPIFILYTFIEYNYRCTVTIFSLLLFDLQCVQFGKVFVKFGQSFRNVRIIYATHLLYLQLKQRKIKWSCVWILIYNIYVEDKLKIQEELTMSQSKLIYFHKKVKFCTEPQSFLRIAQFKPQKFLIF